MKILDDVISALDSDMKVKDIRQGVFQTGVITRNCGLAATLPKDALKQEPPMVKEPGSSLEKSIPELLQMLYFESIFEAAIGMATINSLLDIDIENCLELNAAELLAEKGSGKKWLFWGIFLFYPNFGSGQMSSGSLRKTHTQGILQSMKPKISYQRRMWLGLQGQLLQTTPWSPC